MIKMQFEEHILLKVYSNLLHMIFQKERFQARIGDSIIVGCTIMIVLSIVLRRMLCFALYATCLRRVLGQTHLLLMARRIGTQERKHFSNMWVLRHILQLKRDTLTLKIPRLQLIIILRSVKRVFSAMVLVKTKLRNKIEDSLLDKSSHFH